MRQNCPTRSRFVDGSRQGGLKLCAELLSVRPSRHLRHVSKTRERAVAVQCLAGGAKLTGIGDPGALEFFEVPRFAYLLPHVLVLGRRSRMGPPRSASSTS
jgi:hypothetical protein